MKRIALAVMAVVLFALPVVASAGCCKPKPVCCPPVVVCPVKCPPPPVCPPVYCRAPVYTCPAPCPPPPCFDPCGFVAGVLNGVGTCLTDTLCPCAPCYY